MKKSFPTEFVFQVFSLLIAIIVVHAIYVAVIRPDARASLEQEAQAMLDALGLEGKGNQPVHALSGGEKNVLSLTQALLRKPDLLILDEPTSGLDPQTAQDIVSQARQLADGGRIVFLVTHDVTPSVMSMVDHLLVLAPGGRLAWFGPPDDACAYFGVDSPDAIFARLPEKLPPVWGEEYRHGPSRKKFVGTREHLLGLDPDVGEPVGESEIGELPNRVGLEVDADP